MPEPPATEVFESATLGEPADLLDTPHAGPAAIRGSLLRAAGYVAGILISIVSISLLIRHLGVADFGRYVTVTSLITIVQGVTDAGLTLIGVREFAVRSSTDRDRLMRNLVGVRLAVTLVGVLLATGFAALAGYGSTLVLGTILAGVGLLFSVLQGTFAVPLASRLQLGWVTALDFLRQVLTVVAIIALVIAGATLVPFLGVTIPIGIGVLGVTIALVRGTMPLRPSFERAEWLLLIRGVLPFAAAAVLGTLYFRITIIVMSLIASAVQTGYYATSYRVLEVLVAIPQLVVSSTLPLLARAARDDESRLNYALQRLFEATLIVGVWIGLCVALGAAFAVAVLAGGKSDPSIPVLRIQALAVAANFVAASWQYGLLSLHRHRALLANVVVALSLSLLLTLLLVPRLAAQGAAIAVTSGEVAVAVMAVVLLKRARPELRLSLWVAGRVAVAAALAGGAGMLPGLPSLARAVVATVVYFAALSVMGAIPVEIRSALRLPQIRRSSAST